MLPLFKRYKAFKNHFFESTLPSLTGTVLEIGFGKGLSLTSYRNADRVFAVEIDDKGVRNAQHLLDKHRISNVFPMKGSVEELDFENNFFDHVTCSFTLCSVNDQRKAIQEIYRVLKPGGTFIALEHTLSNSPFFSFLQRVLSRPLSFCSNNCKLDSHPQSILAHVNLIVTETRYMPFFLEPPLYVEAVKDKSLV